MIGAILHLDKPVPPVKLPGLFCSGMHLNSHSADDFGNLNCLFYRMREKSFSQPSALHGEINAKLAQKNRRRWVPRKTFGTSKILRKVFELYVARSERIKPGYVAGGLLHGHVGDPVSQLHVLPGQLPEVPVLVTGPAVELPNLVFFPELLDPKTHLADGGYPNRLYQIPRITIQVGRLLNPNHTA